VLSGFRSIEGTISPSSAARGARLLEPMTFASVSLSLSANRSRGRLSRPAKQNRVGVGEPFYVEGLVFTSVVA
jgi:hypothetical protein